MSQLCPAEGWYVRLDCGPDEPRYYRVAAWLLEDSPHEPGEVQAVPMTAEGNILAPWGQTDGEATLVHASELGAKNRHTT
jgi:hypothetical protein